MRQTDLPVRVAFLVDAASQGRSGLSLLGGLGKDGILLVALDAGCAALQTLVSGHRVVAGEVLGNGVVVRRAGVELSSNWRRISENLRYQ